MAATKMVSMKRVEQDKGDMMTNAPVEAMAPDYPYGLCLHLDRDEIKKLGMKELPKIGTEMPITGIVKVTRVSQSAVEGSDEESSIDLQITDLGIS